MQGDDQGVQVATIVPGSPAEKAGVKVGDKVISIAGVSIFDFDADKMRSIADTAKTITLVVMRGDEKKTFQIEPAVISMPSGDPASPAPSGSGATGKSNPR
jgi:C-terminal processing protease CtpA/Prc